jgi:hypothetical protein
MANKIQIKRSVANATVSGLSNGELAFTQASNTLHIGLPDGSGVLRIGGAQYPGVLTNSHALVANASGEIDKVIVANAVVTSLVANGSPGSNGQVLVSNGTGTYWGTGTSGQNTYIQFNDSGVANGVAGFTFTKTSNTLFVGNTVVVTNINVSSVNATSYLAGNVTTGSDGFYANATTVIVGNNTINSSLTSTTLQIAYPLTGTGGINVGNTTIIVGNNTINTTVGAGFLNVNGATIANTTGVYTSQVVNSASFTVGTSLIGNSTGVYHVGVINATSFNAGNTTTGTGGVLSNATVVTVGNNTINTRITSAGLTVNGQSIANNTGFYTSGTVNALSATIGTAANFTANTTHVVFDGPTITAVNASASVNNMTVNTNLVVTSNTNLNGNTVIGDSTSDRLNVGALVSSNLIPSANVSFNLGNNSLRWNEGHFGNVHATAGYFDGSVEISGDLVISGNVTTTNVNSLVVSDPMIYLAGNNYTSDLLDIGFAANYFDGSTARHTGLFRDASDAGIYKLFTNSEQELSGNNVVNTSANGWTLAILQSYIQSAGFISNATSITITANSSLNVAIVANTLTLSSPLLGNSGGTGLNTYTQEDIIVANSTNGFRKLGLGTSGYVLQSNGTALLYDILDGGSF